MNNLLDQIRTLALYQLDGPNPLPFPAYALFPFFGSNIGVNPLTSKISLVLIFSAIFLILRFVKTLKISKINMKTVINLGVCVIPFICLYSRETDARILLSEIFAILAIQSFIKEHYLSAAAFLSLLAASDACFYPVGFAFVLLTCKKTYIRLINPNYSIFQTILKGLKTLTLLSVVPLIFCTAFLLLDLSIRDHHSVASLSFPLSFQATLKHFNITQGFIEMHKPGHPSKTDRYVMDRSIITLHNKKHNVFFSINEVINGSKIFIKFCEIHKIHKKNFEDEEPRFLKNGDFVKFKHIEKDLFVGIKRKDADEKFVELSLGAFEKDEDLWEIITDGYLQARFSEVIFKNVGSGDHLCAKTGTNLPTLSSSFYSDKQSRIFHIAGNINHGYFKNTFNDPRAKETTSEYLRLTFLNKFRVYLGALDLKANSKLEAVSMRKMILFVAIAPLVLAIVFLNELFKARKIPSFPISKQTSTSVIVLVVVGMFAPIIGLRVHLIGTIGLLSLFYIGLDLSGQKREKVNHKRKIARGDSIRQ